MDQQAAGTNRYRIVSKLCSGGMADIFLGIQLDQQVFDRLVVIKKIHRVDEADSDLSRMFADEARIVSTLSHPHIVQIFDFAEDADAFHIIMEYIDGENLGYILSELRKLNIRIPLPIVFRLMEQALEALQYIHTATARSGESLRIIHRDLDPRNLMMDGNGYLKIIDFGVAKAVLQTELTAPGLFKGKLSHVAPEMFTQPEIDHRADIYSIGLVLYEMVTGERPFRIGNSAAPAEAIRRIVDEPILPPSALRPDISPELEAIITKACHKDRDQRHQSAEALRYAISCIAYNDTSGVGIASNAAVKMWFRTLFDERLAKRRLFEIKTIEKARMTLQGIRPSRPSSPPPVMLENDRAMFSSTPGEEYPPGCRVSGVDAGSDAAFNTGRSGRISSGPAGNNWSVPPGPSAETRNAFHAEQAADAEPWTGRGYFWKVAAVTAFVSLAAAGLFMVYWNGNLPFFNTPAVENEVHTAVQTPASPQSSRLTAVPHTAPDAANTAPDPQVVEPSASSLFPPQNAGREAAIPAVSSTAGDASPQKTWTWYKETARRKKLAEEAAAVAAAAVPLPPDPYATSDIGGALQAKEPTAAVQSAAASAEDLPGELTDIQRKAEPRPIVAAPLTTSALKPSSTPPPTPISEKWLSGTGNWNGAAVAAKGCGSCHADLKATAKTASQWTYFFSHNRHRQYADLKKLFSQQELRRVESHLISNAEQNKPSNSGIAGVR